MLDIDTAYYDKKDVKNIFNVVMEIISNKSFIKYIFIVSIIFMLYIYNIYFINFILNCFLTKRKRKLFNVSKSILWFCFIWNI